MMSAPFKTAPTSKSQRTLAQQNIYSRMQVFWAKGKDAQRSGATRKGIKKPWRSELLKGVVYVRFLFYKIEGLRTETPYGRLLDWCELHSLKWSIHPTNKLPYAKYIRKNMPYWTLTVQIPK
jgi:hypothetical protein